MLRLMELPEPERRAMGERGHDHMRAHYGLGRVVERWEELYREVLARKGPALAPRVSGVGGTDLALRRRRRSGGRRATEDLQILLPEVQPAPAHRVVQLAIRRRSSAPVRPA